MKQLNVEVTVVTVNERKQAQARALQRSKFTIQFRRTCKFSKMIADIVRLEIICRIFVIDESHCIGFFIDQNVAQQQIVVRKDHWAFDFAKNLV